jgi:CDP-diglyceride synthetase
MEATTNYNENNAILELKKSRRTKRILWKLNFILLCNSVFDFINLKFSPQFHWFWFSAVLAGIWSSDACFTSFGYSTELGRAKN